MPPFNHIPHPPHTHTLPTPKHTLKNSHIPLPKPRPRNHTQLLPQPPEPLRPLRDNDDSLLHRTPRHVRRPPQQRRRVQLPRARDAEEGCRGPGPGAGLAEGEVGEVFGCAGGGREGVLAVRVLLLLLLLLLGIWGRDGGRTHAHRPTAP